MHGSNWPARSSALMAAELASKRTRLQKALEKHVRAHLDELAEVRPDSVMTASALTGLRRRGRDPAHLARGLAPDPDLTVSEWADRHRMLSAPRPPPNPGAIARAHALHARDHGRAVARRCGAAHRVHEGGAGRRDRGGQQLDRLRHPPRAGADAGGAADGGTGQAQLAPADRPADRGKPAICGSGSSRRGRATRGNTDAVQGVPGRHPDHDRGELGGRAAVDAGALHLPRRGRRLSGDRRRGRRSGHAGRGPVADLRARRKVFLVSTPTIRG